MKWYYSSINTNDIIGGFAITYYYIPFPLKFSISVASKILISTKITIKKHRFPNFLNNRPIQRLLFKVYQKIYFLCDTSKIARTRKNLILLLEQFRISQIITDTTVLTYDLHRKNCLVEEGV